MHGHRHLQRLRWVWSERVVYFVTVCLAKRRPLLAKPATYKILADELGILTTRHGWAVGPYVVMPDHIHMFLGRHSLAAKSLSDAMGKWKEWTAKGILPLVGVAAPLWQPEFFDHVLRSQESREEKWNYMRENPV
jgi:putative transposase